MWKHLRAAAMALPLLSGCLLYCVGAGAAPEVSHSSESNLLPYANSLAFDLHPRVNRASFHLRRPDLQAIYKAIAEAYGIRLLNDRDLGATRLVSAFELEDVTLRQALEAAGNISKTFVAPVDEHTGIVAADTAQKRGEYERQVLRNFQIDYPTTAQELTEITTALRTLLDLRRVSQDNRSNWISVLGRTRQVVSATQFVRSLEKERGEVMLDVDILEVDSQRARELGILPPQPFQLLYLGLSGAASAASVLTFGGGQTLYGVNLPGASATLTFSSSAIRSLQRLQLRASDGQEASLLLGERFPVLNAIVSSGFSLQQGSQASAASADLGFYPSTQYEDLGVKLKATPYLHAGRELTLKLDLSLRDLGAQSLNGAPIISNRQVTEQIRLRDGDNYLISGILSQQQDTSLRGYPWLSRLPLLGSLFGSRSRRQTQTEFLMLIRPHVIRRSPAEEYASASIYFGKELQGLPAAPPPPPPLPVVQPPAPGVPPQPGIPPQPGVVPQPGVAPQPGAPPAVPPGMVPPTPQEQPGGQPQTAPPQPPLPPGLLPPGIVPQPQAPPQPQQEQQQQ